MHATRTAPRRGTASVLADKHPLGQALPAALVALLSQQLLCHWYDAEDPAEQQVRRTGLLLNWLPLNSEAHVFGVRKPQRDALFLQCNGPQCGCRSIQGFGGDGMRMSLPSLQ